MLRRALPGAIVLMLAARLPFMGVPAGRDEAGYLLVAAAWGRGGESLYGSYWVDRPPLLIWLAELAGSVPALRVMGLVASVISVLAIAWAAHLVAGSRAAAWAGGAAALFSAAPWLGVARVNGEMLGGVFVAGSIALTVRAMLGPDRRRLAFATLAGGCAAAAVLVKQTTVDGIVFALVLAAALAWQQPHRRRATGQVVAAGAAAAVSTVAVALALASARGTGPAALFDAVVTFRVQAGEVIRTSASGATVDRLGVLVATWLVSGLAVVAVLAVAHTWRRRDPVLLAATATIVAISLMALLGGSYWGHYLQQLVPASALAAGLLADRIRPRLGVGLAGVVVALTVGNLGWNAVHPPDEGHEAEVVGGWLHDSSHPGDTVVVAFGQANVLTSAHMRSPYEYLWSLPARTRDADLSELATVLAGPDRPTWFVNWSGLDTWGVDASDLRPVVAEHYRRAATVCGRTVWLDVSADRAPAPSGRCR